jgi:hypothetical protein
VKEIAQLTRLNLRLIEDTIRRGQALGMLTPSQRGYCITWLWYRAVTRFLHRRHLLSISNLKGTSVV